MELVRIHSVAVGGTIATLSFDTGEDLSIDFAERVKNRPKLKPILEELDAGKIIDSRIAVEWPSGIAIDAQSLYRTAHGMAVKIWRKRHRLSQNGAGDALGITGRTIQLYEGGERPITKTIKLAMLGYDALRNEAAD
jgi:hypothetical protein